jgi:hypothetical protein
MKTRDYQREQRAILVYCTSCGKQVMKRELQRRDALPYHDLCLMRIEEAGERQKQADALAEPDYLRLLRMHMGLPVEGKNEQEG